MQRHSSFEIEEVEDEDAYAPRAGSRDTRRILELADGSNDDDDDDLVVPPPIDAASSAAPSNADSSFC